MQHQWYWAMISSLRKTWLVLSSAPCMFTCSARRSFWIGISKSHLQFLTPTPDSSFFLTQLHFTSHDAWPMSQVAVHWCGNFTPCMSRRQCLTSSCTFVLAMVWTTGNSTSRFGTCSYTQPYFKLSISSHICLWMFKAHCTHWVHLQVFGGPFQTLLCESSLLPRFWSMTNDFVSFLSVSVFGFGCLP